MPFRKSAGDGRPASVRFGFDEIEGGLEKGEARAAQGPATVRSGADQPDLVLPARFPGEA